MWEHRWVFARGNQTGKVCHINMQIRTNHVRDFAHTLKVDLTRDRRTTCDDQFWIMLFGQGFDLIIINTVVFAAYTVLNRVKPLTGLVWRRTVC